MLARLLAHPNANTFDITVLVRSPEKAGKLKTFGVTPVLGSLEDLDLLEDLASKAHVVFSCANSDDLPSVNAILKGMRKRHTSEGDLPILIHTSGTGVLTYGDDAMGVSISEKVYDDANADEIESLPETALHRHVDLPIVRADKEGYLKSYIVLPSNVWGIAKNSLVDAGIVNPHSKLIPMFISAALARGRIGVVGKGIPVWGNVEIEELANLFIILYDALTKDPENVGHGRDGYYFGIGKDANFSWYEVAKEIGTVLVELGIHKEAEPDSFTREELVKYLGFAEIDLYIGTSSRGVANHSKSLGWNPRQGTQGMLWSIKSEVEVQLKQQKE